MLKKKFISKGVLLLLLNIIIFGFVTDKCYANLDNLTFNNKNIEQGISQSTVSVIFQDSKGYIWLGTSDGLNRYNGYEYKIYNYEEGQNSISHNDITDIIEDNKENLWVSTVQGVNKINTSTGKINNYTEGNKKINDDSITESIKTRDNKIIVTTYRGLNVYNEKKDCFEVVQNKDKGIISDTIYSIDEDDDGNLWIGTDLGVNKISKDFKVLETYPINDKENYLGDSEIYTVYCDDKSNDVWIGSSSCGLFKIDNKTKKIIGYKNNPNDSKSLPANQVEAILRDKQGNLWIGTSGGLARLDEDNDYFDTYKNKIYDKNSLVYDNVRALMQDKEGIIWVGTYSGVSIFDADTKIKHYKAGFDNDYLLKESMVQGVYEDNDGYIWVGSKSKGVSIVDREKHTSEYINTKNNHVIGSDTINDITGYKDFIFIATDNGLLKIDKKNNTMKNYTTSDNLVHNVIKDILVDDKGYLWIGTMSGLSIMNLENNEVIDMSHYIKNDKYIRHIYQDSDGDYFLGLLKDEGLCYINVKEKKIKYYKNKEYDKTSISSDRIRYINGDKDGYIWIGTSYGLNRFDKKTEKFERYTAKDGIANNTVYGVLVDNNDDIWISTNKGISKINKKTNNIENFSIIDGLQSNEFNGNSCFKSKSGELFFGGINGLNAFYPDDLNKINNVDKDIKVLFDSFEIDNKEYSNIDGMKLSRNTGSITINFFSPIYSSDKKIMYEYKLVGASHDSSTTKNNHVTYNDLSPGKYTFLVRVIDTSGNKSGTNSVTFTIKAPFWMSPLAILIYIIIILLLFLWSKYEVRKLDNLVNERTKNLQEQIEKNTVLHRENLKLERNKNSYFVNLSHELRTPLNVISSTNQLIKELNKKKTPISNEKLSHYIDISQKNCDRLLNLINNILDNSKMQNNMYEIHLREADIVYTVEETALTLRDYINSKGIELIIDPEIEEKTIKCDSHEIERCIINLIGNATKFTPEGGKITVTIEDLDDKVKISVCDTGIGIEEKFHKSIFNRFNQVTDNDDAPKGSGLGLTITNQIIKLHKGDIYVESKVGEGSNFIIILPVDPENI